MSLLMRTPSDLAEFVALSMAITAFSEVDVRGTGLVESHLDTIETELGKGNVDALLNAWRSVASIADATARVIALRRDVFDDLRLGPIASALTKLWYIGTWYPPAAAWRSAYAPAASADPFVPEPAAYIEGLLWPAIGAHPPGAKAPGYGSWAHPPVISYSFLDTPQS